MPSTVVVTGASSGIGLDLVRRLASGGWRVFAGVRRAADAAAVVSLAPERVTAVTLDVTAAESIAAAAGEVEVALAGAGLGALVNNAGIAVAGPVEAVPLADVRRQLEVNVIGVVATTQAFLPLLRRGGGRIVMMSSVSGRLAFPWLGSYAASKHAVEALADSLRRELAEERIGVTVVEPGAVQTPIWERSGAALAIRMAALPWPAAARLARDHAIMRAHFATAEGEGCAPALVSAAVAHALTARRPPTRIAVGSGARLAVLLRFLPDRWVDAIIRRSLRR